jgi:hypothetical protein
MDSPPKSPNGNTPVRVTRVTDAGHPGRVTRVASWLVNLAIPKLIPDHRTARLRQHARDADDRLERTARRSSAAKSSRARQIPTGAPDEQHGRVA